MLGLRQQVGRNVTMIGVVGNDDNLSRPRDKIDSYFPGQ